jgi:hypothetical protein
MREYRVWQGEEIYSVVSVDLFKANGRVRIYVDSDLVGTETDLNAAYMKAEARAHDLVREAQDACSCGEPAEECGSAYDAPHGVRLQVTDEEENRELDPTEY